MTHTCICSSYNMSLRLTLHSSLHSLQSIRWSPAWLSNHLWNFRFVKVLFGCFLTSWRTASHDNYYYCISIWLLKFPYVHAHTHAHTYTHTHNPIAKHWAFVAINVCKFENFLYVWQQGYCCYVFTPSEQGGCQRHTRWVCMCMYVYVCVYVMCVYVWLFQMQFVPIITRNNII